MSSSPKINWKNKKGSFYVVCGQYFTKDIDYQKSHRLPSVNWNSTAKKITLNHLSPCSYVFAEIINKLAPYHPDVTAWDVEIYNLSHSKTARWEQYYRMVSYWITQPRCDLTRPPRWFYHGTNSNSVYEILQTGLKPRKEGHIGHLGSYGASGALSHSDKVYLSAHPDAAARSAAFQSANAHGGFPTIIRINSSYLNTLLLDADEDADTDEIAENGWKAYECMPPPGYILSLQEMGTCAYNGTISADAIMPFIRCTSLFESDKNLQWIKWDDPVISSHRLTLHLQEAFESERSVMLDTPIRLALLDAGLLIKEEVYDNWGSKHIYYHPAGLLDDRQVKTAIIEAPWTQLAADLLKDGIPRLDSTPLPQKDPQIQLILNLLLRYKIYYSRSYEGNKYLTSGHIWLDEERAVKLAKHLYFYNYSFDELRKKLGQIEYPAR